MDGSGNKGIPGWSEGAWATPQFGFPIFSLSLKTRPFHCCHFRRGGIFSFSLVPLFPWGTTHTHTQNTKNTNSKNNKKKHNNQKNTGGAHSARRTSASELPPTLARRGFGHVMACAKASSAARRCRRILDSSVGGGAGGGGELVGVGGGGVWWGGGWGVGWGGMGGGGVAGLELVCGGGFGT